MFAISPYFLQSPPHRYPLLVQKRSRSLTMSPMLFMFTIGLVVMVVRGSHAILDMPLPLTTYNYSISLQENVSVLWWNVNEVTEEIIFELHVKTTGWIALGISPGKLRWIPLAYRYEVLMFSIQEAV